MKPIHNERPKEQCKWMRLLNSTSGYCTNPLAHSRFYFVVTEKGAPLAMGACGILENLTKPCIYFE